MAYKATQLLVFLGNEPVGNLSNVEGEFVWNAVVCEGVDDDPEGVLLNAQVHGGELLGSKRYKTVDLCHSFHFFSYGWLVLEVL